MPVGESDARTDRAGGLRCGRAAVIGVGAVVICLMVFAGWSGPDAPHRGLAALIVLADSLPWVLAWLAAALGTGWPLRAWLAPKAEERLALQAAFGVAVMLILVSALGRIGALHAAGGAGGWVVIVVGVALLLMQLVRALGRDWNPVLRGERVPLPHPVFWAAAPAIAVLLLASLSPPGWLWASEFGGYDVKSYHLQLPKEWLALGTITPVEQNVYSFFPNYVEAAYAHLMVLRGRWIQTIEASQLLHAGFAMLTAVLVGRLAGRVVRGDLPAEAGANGNGRMAGAIAAALVVTTPWVIVTGSLAYNEMAVALMLVGALLLLREQTVAPARLGAGLGLLAGAACGAKLTAVGFVALPVGILLFWRFAPRCWPAACAAGAVAGLLALGPYLIGNAVIAGNPIFPFGAHAIGSAHWTAEQAAIWNAGHRGEQNIGQRLIEAWHQLLRYGIGPNPHPSEPWQAHWSILPWLALLSVFGLRLMRPRQRHWMMLLGMVVLVQVLFWIGLTHIKSRFMTPMVVPGAVMAALAVGVMWAGPRASAARLMADGKRNLQRGAQVTCAAGVLALAVVPVFIFIRQRDGAPAAQIGMTRLLTGDGLSGRERREIGQVLPTVYINHVLPADAKVLFVGEAAPLYYDLEKFTYNTTWDRGPLSCLLREHPNDPVTWTNELRRMGYTHVLIQPRMLRVWEEAGWNDPLITAESVRSALEAAADFEREWPGGQRLYRL